MPRCLGPIIECICMRLKNVLGKPRFECAAQAFQDGHESV